MVAHTEHPRSAPLSASLERPRAAKGLAGGLGRRPVADLVAVLVVDALESVEVDEQHRAGPPRFIGMLDALLQPAEQGGSVGEPRLWVVTGSVVQGDGGLLGVNTAGLAQAQQLGTGPLVTGDGDPKLPTHGHRPEPRPATPSPHQGRRAKTPVGAGDDRSVRLSQGYA